MFDVDFGIVICWEFVIVIQIDVCVACFDVRWVCLDWLLFGLFGIIDFPIWVVVGWVLVAWVVFVWLDVIRGVLLGLGV